MASDEGPRVLVLGGVGFVGRNFVTYLAKNKLAGKILVSDKVLPATANLNDEEKAIFESDLVSFKQANLAREATIDKVFEHEGGKYDYVFNLAAATKYSQVDEVYKENIVDLSKICSAAAKKHGAKRFIEVSTAQVYDSGKKPSDEKAKLKPWTLIAKASLNAENEVKNSGVNHIIVRPAVIYGKSDTQGITPRLVIGAVYREIGKTMELLWDKHLKINTVHVNDVAKALWFLKDKGENGAIYNLADENDTDQGSVNKLLEEIFGIKCGFLGSIKSKMATAMAMSTVVSVANDKHLQPWSELCKKHDISYTPLTPYLDAELLLNNSLGVDGSAIKALGFSYDHPKMTTALLKEVLDDFIAKGYFPKGMTV